MILNQKPENALKRVEELVAVNQRGTALTLLHEIIVSKRGRSASLSILHPIIEKFNELAVSMGRGKVAKEALNHYKNICIQYNASSAVIKAVKQFLDLSKENLKTAQNKANQENLKTIGDLDESETPESVMAQEKDRTTRELAPCLRFLWDAYRTALDTLRNNNSLEPYYQQVAQEAFRFCMTFGRKAEFRKICDSLRLHLGYTTKHANAIHAVDLNDPATLQRHLDTRFVQLTAAKELELWQECFRSVEDINNLMHISEMNPDPKMIIRYFDILNKVLMVGGNYLFHAAAFHKYFTICRENGALRKEDFAIMATKLLLSALAAPNQKQNSIEERLKSQKLVGFLLYDSEVPIRAELLEYALKKDILNSVNEEVRELYKLIEVEFHPLSICQKVSPILKKLATQPELEKYIRPLRDFVLTRLLQQLSQAYSSIKIESVVRMAQFPAPYNYTPHDIERFVVIGNRRGEFKIKIDQINQSFVFGKSKGNVTESLGVLQAQINRFAARLQKVAIAIDSEYLNVELEAKRQAFTLAMQNLDSDRKETEDRRERIEMNIQLRETKAEQREQERQQRIIAVQQAEEARLSELERLKADQRLEQQRKEIELAEEAKLAGELVAELRKKNVKIKDEDLLDTKKLKILQLQQNEKEKRELEQKRKSIAKKLDHFARALRKEEIPLLDDHFKKQNIKEREEYEKKKANLLEVAREKFDRELEIKTKLVHIKDDFFELKKKLMKAREEEYDVLRAEANKKMELEKEERRAEHAKALEEKAKAEEEAKIKAKEAEAARLEDERKKAEQKMKLEEQARKQKEKEAAIEAKLEQQANPTSRPAQTWKPGSGGWREKQQQKTGAVPPPSGKPNPFGSAAPRGESNAFNSVNSRRNDNPSGSSQSSGPPRIGAGRWASRKEK